MKKTFIFSSVEVALTDKCSMKSHMQDVKGAFMHCLVGADNLANAKALLKSALIEDGYKIVSIGIPMKFDDYRIHGKVTKDIDRAAIKVSVSGGVWYSVLYCYCVNV